MSAVAPAVMTDRQRVAALVLFVRHQATATAPVLPLGLFGIRERRYGFAVQGLAGAAMMRSMAYVMVCLQIVRGIAASSAGLCLIPVAIGMTPIGLLSDRLAAAGRPATPISRPWTPSSPRRIRSSGPRPE